MASTPRTDPMQMPYLIFFSFALMLGLMASCILL
jgi:hypothetical protein